ncbi:MAG TPA: hypothetical protein VM617_04245, partial [Thermoanaerobaculia bacterium]|nr:hypothetical protein [Thermoanaerobaculia bacterium]
MSRRRTVLVHSGLLLVVLGFFRLEKGLQLVPPARSIEWLALLLPEAGFVALFAAFWLLAARLTRHRGRLWASLFHLSVVAIYLVSLLDHLWLLYTGTRLHLALVVYSARYFEMLIGLLGSGVNLRFWVRFALVGLCYLLGLRLERLGRPLAAPASRWPAVAAAAFGLLVLLPAWPVPYRVADLWSTSAVELFAGIRLDAPEGGELAPYLIE